MTKTARVDTKSGPAYYAVVYGTPHGGQLSSNRKNRVAVKFAIQWHNMAIRLSSTQELATAIWCTLESCLASHCLRVVHVHNLHLRLNRRARRAGAYTRPLSSST